MKITPPGKIRVLHLDYWCPEFRDRGLWGTTVKVRYDPDDRGHVEAWVNGQWRECTSEHHRVFKGRSQREVEVAARIFGREQSAVRNRRTDPSGYRLAAILERAHEYEALRLAELKQQEKRRSGSAWRRLKGREDLATAASAEVGSAGGQEPDSAVTIPFPADRCAASPTSTSPTCDERVGHPAALPARAAGRSHPGAGRLLPVSLRRPRPAHAGGGGREAGHSLPR